MTKYKQRYGCVLLCQEHCHKQSSFLRKAHRLKDGVWQRRSTVNESLLKIDTLNNYNVDYIWQFSPLYI